jgi:hypothetical protein
MAILPEAIYMFNVISIKIPITSFFFERKINPKLIWKDKRPQIAYIILCKKNNAEGIAIPDFKL